MNGNGEMSAMTSLLQRGVLSSRGIGALAKAGAIDAAAPFADDQIQPASLDLRLGPKAYRVRASFLPGRGRSVATLPAAMVSAGASASTGSIPEIPLGLAAE